uniref:amino acid adenylation domain-containing protein n=1 Tax=Phenylobacterium sp. TaxID=1871053 RepID=UPI00356A8E59
MNIDIGARYLGWIIREAPSPDFSTIQVAFRDCVRRTPGAIALAIGRTEGPPTDTLTYAELDTRAQRLARALVAGGVKPGDRVGVATKRDFDVAIAMLGVLLAGGVYVPLDPSQPRQRLDFIQNDSGLRVVVQSAGLGSEVAAAGVHVVEIGAPPAPGAVELPASHASDPAYIVYASGPAGEPVGVVTPHRAILRLTLGVSYAALGPDRRILQMSPISLDAATFEVWAALLNSGTCVIYPDAGPPDLGRLRAVLETARINTLWLSGSLFNAIVDADVGMLARVEELLVGGEPLSVEHVRRASAQISANIVNVYGPTETTAFACCHRLPHDLPASMTAAPIGLPIEHTAVAILDADLSPVRQGEVGELCIAGDGLALGYHNHPELTAERFVRRRGAPGGRFFRTGDNVRMLPSGDLEFVGHKASSPGPATGGKDRGDATTLTALLDAAAARFPDNVAVRRGQSQLTYAELVQRAERVARALRARGVGSDVRVGLCAERSLDLLVGLVGILKAGGAYVPLDPTYPAERLGFIVEDAGIQVAVATDGAASALESCGSGTLEILNLGELAEGDADEAGAAAPAPQPGDAAYVIYTSGSTGKPKGVVVTHHNVCRLLQQTEPWFQFGPTDVWTLFHSFAFDFSVWEIWGALAYGGRVVVVPYETSRNPDEFYRLLAVEGVTVLNQTPSAFRRLAATAVALPDLKAEALRVVIFGGEALDFRTLEPWLSVYPLGPPRLVNMYGITETTVHVTYHEIKAEDLAGGRSLIGQPIPDLSLHVLDPQGKPAPADQPGELYVGGEGVARGYLNRPELTAERFIADPNSKDPQARLYRTGDLAQRLADGNIEYLGRIDDQVKIRGFRIELGEIEAAATGHPAVRESVVVARDDGADETRLVAYLVAVAGAAQPSTTELRRHLGGRLPDYMLPSAFVWLDAVPLTANGKVDRRALPAPSRERPTLEQAFAAPRGDFERFVADSWRELVGVDRVGRHDRFFELGGTSLLAMRFLEICRSQRGLRLSVAEFFDGPTVENIARIAEQRRAAEAPIAAAPAKPAPKGDRIAIVGLAGRFAGAPDVASFWEMILAGRSGRVEITRADLEAAGEDPALLDDPDYVAAAFPLDDAEGFDAAFFGFTPREAELMDPQQRIMLEAAWTALEDAGVDPRQGSDRIGVFGGVGRNAYLLNNLMTHQDLRETAGDYNMLIGNERDFPTTHIAYRLGLRGPAVNVQTACSTSGVAIHMAAESLRRGECDMALAGGAKVLAPNRVGYRYVEGGPLSPDGVLRAFDAEANGMVRGSGVAMVALKRLEDAMADGDHIYGVLIGSAVNNDGEAKAGFTAPSVSGQAAVIAEAYRQAGVSADSVSLIEAHGTGTVLGDPIEVEGLTRAFRLGPDQAGSVAIGSVKTNIGHLDAGATAAGLIKAVLALENEIIPPSLNFTAPNPRIGFCDSPFYVAAEATEWKRGDVARRAGISSFGLGGTNAHLLIEEAPSRPASGAAEGAQLLVLSARTDAALAKRCADLADWLEGHAAANLADVAHTLRVGRRRFEKRLALVCADRDDAIAKLRRMTPGEVLRGAGAAEAPPVAFLFPGGGAQYAGMARELYGACAPFRAALDTCSRIYEARAGRPLTDAIFEGEGALDQPTVALPALFAVEYAMAQTWLAWGVEPDAMIGHSMGEYTAACVAGVFSLEDAIDIVMCRGRLFDTLQPGGMLSVPLAAKALEGRLGAELSIAAINRDDQCVVSGPDEAIQALADALEAEGVETRRVHINVAAHSALVEPILGEFRAQFERLTLNRPQRPFLSNLTGDWITDEEATDPGYWVSHLRSTVLFCDGISRLLEDPERIFLEIGPGQVLSTLTRQNSRRGAGHDVIATIKHPQETASDADFLMGALGRFWLAGGKADWVTFAGAPRRRVPLPTYPFERTRHWIEAVPYATSERALPAAAPVAAAVAAAAPGAAPGPPGGGGPTGGPPPGH